MLFRELEFRTLINRVKSNFTDATDSVADVQETKEFVEYDAEKLLYQTPYDYQFLRPLTKKNKQFLWECEEERFVFKACLRKVSTLERNVKNTSWDTAPVSNLQLT